MRAVLGFDTSCYTTSCAVAFEDGRFDQRRRLLDVPQGQRGLQQSQGVFQHVGRMPALVEALMAACEGAEIVGVCASTRPRPVDGSYMPVFTVGEGCARQTAAALRVPFIATSHQQGHIRAAMVDTGLTASDHFLALHLSGGTTELLHVTPQGLALIGGSNDLHAGQFIDRVGVRLGLRFPAGPALEALAMKGHSAARLPIWVRGTEMSLSGSESAAQRMIDAGALPPEDMAAEVFSCVARSVSKMLCAAAWQTGEDRILLCGGVSSSSLLRSLLPDRMRRLGEGASLYWGRPDLSGDNAVGAALIGRDALGLIG